MSFLSTKPKPKLLVRLVPAGTTAEAAKLPCHSLSLNTALTSEALPEFGTLVRLASISSSAAPRAGAAPQHSAASAIRIEQRRRQAGGAAGRLAIAGPAGECGLSHTESAALGEGGESAGGRVFQVFRRPDGSLGLCARRNHWPDAAARTAGRGRKTHIPFSRTGSPCLRQRASSDHSDSAHNAKNKELTQLPIHHVAAPALRPLAPKLRQQALAPRAVVQLLMNVGVALETEQGAAVRAAHNDAAHLAAARRIRRLLLRVLRLALRAAAAQRLAAAVAVGGSGVGPRRRQVVLQPAAALQGMELEQQGLQGAVRTACKQRGCRTSQCASPPAGCTNALACLQGGNHACFPRPALQSTRCTGTPWPLQRNILAPGGATRHGKLSTQYGTRLKLGTPLNTTHLRLLQLLRPHFPEGLDREEVVVGTGQVGRGHQAKAAHVASAGQLGGTRAAAGTGVAAWLQLALGACEMQGRPEGGVQV